MRTAAVLPVKRFAQAKQRLAPAVAESLRLDLARAMVGDVLVALCAVPQLDPIVVVTGEPGVAASASYLDLLVVEEEDDGGQSAAATLGIRRALAEGAERVLLVPADCPAVDPTQLSALLAGAGPDPGVVVVPDRHGTGTNALLLTPPEVIAPSFGPGSCERHRQLAAAVAVACRVERVASLLLDVDTGADLQALRDRLACVDGGATRTRTVLAGFAGPVAAA